MGKMEAEAGIQELQQLSAVYELLSRLWRSEADRQVLELLSEPGMQSAWEKLGGCVPTTIDDALLEELAVDYCQLLVGPTNPISPIQSVWKHQRLQSESAESMQNYFKLIPYFKPAIEIPDHFAVQLQFMAELLSRCTSESDAGMSIADEYFSRHLSWSKEFLVHLRDRANSEFYGSLATLTCSFLHGEQ